jgi:hypothetical protein
LVAFLQAFLGEKLGAMFQRPQDENRDDVPWFMRYGARALGTVGGGSEFCTIFASLLFYLTVRDYFGLVSEQNCVRNELYLALIFSGLKQIFTSFLWFCRRFSLKLILLLFLSFDL